MIDDSQGINEKFELSFDQAPKFVNSDVNSPIKIISLFDIFGLVNYENFIEKVTELSSIINQRPKHISETLWVTLLAVILL